MNIPSANSTNHLVIGGAGAVGRRLMGALLARGDRVVCADYSERSLPPAFFLRSKTIRETPLLQQRFGVDVRDKERLTKLLQEYGKFVQNPHIANSVGGAAGDAKSAKNADSAENEVRSRSYMNGNLKSYSNGGNRTLHIPSPLQTSYCEHFGLHKPVTVWNLAAPLSVETARNPDVARGVTVGGMKNVLEAMTEWNESVGWTSLSGRSTDGGTGSGSGNDSTSDGNGSNFVQLSSNTSNSNSNDIPFVFTRLMFTDSIGSFGATAPRTGATARWLIENPDQDPGSDYGLQKRACRELMAEFSQKCGLDTRFAVLPGVLHSEALWGAGTTEYALDALKFAVLHCDPEILRSSDRLTNISLDGSACSIDDSSSGTRGGSDCAMTPPFRCPVLPETLMPMVFSEDLVRGLVALSDAAIEDLKEPQRGYCLPGVSFSAQDLFEEIQSSHYPNFRWEVELDENMDKFSRLWPDSLSMEEPKRDLGFEATKNLQDIVKVVIDGHRERYLGDRVNPPELNLETAGGEGKVSTGSGGASGSGAEGSDGKNTEKLRG